MIKQALASLFTLVVINFTTGAKGITKIHRFYLKCVNHRFLVLYRVYMTYDVKSGAPWSGGLIRHVRISLTAPRVEGSNPSLSLF